MKTLLFILTGVYGLLMSCVLLAEPYLAVQSGHSCGTCHINKTGGGARNAFGNIYAQTQLPAEPYSGEGSALKLWQGTLSDRFAIGGNARYGGRQFELDDRDDNLNFDVDSVTLYFAAKLNDKIEFYLDQQVAPGGALNREAWVQLTLDNWHIKAGRLFLPFGWRLQDDTAFVRSITGINFNSGDNGIELGYHRDHWDIQLAVTNGTAGAIEVDDGKQLSLRSVYRRDSWRVGVNSNINNTDNGERIIYGLFAGLRTGPVSWLLEYDVIDDEGFGAALDGEQDVALVEANIRILKGHNIKLSAEMNSIDLDNPESNLEAGLDDRFRYSAVWEYFPWAFTQLRVGARSNDSDGDSPQLNSDEIFVQAHVFF